MVISKARKRAPFLGLLAVVSVCLVIAGTSNAHADAVDDAFLNAVKTKGINFASPQAAIIAGHEVCDELDLGRQKGDVANEVSANSNLDGYRAGYFVGVSIAAFCPRHHAAA
ncbi:DUF732 domain-containing protein [Mycobacterium kubicae]|uniref:DUF732 domain-containing protein n=1 Tax=Mycobacterium kubicae TaxID=120959 RepID=UPI00163EBDC8|nr:DUF732 domain-containing protein [Mycobacterium kubicae]QNI05894.1 DUF732 domain-containing protein [Mycobacterium kubicae]